jgi:hypothetical protein
VGARALTVKTFLFDYVCSNRIVWGALELDEITIRHTASAPDRFIEQVQPALLNYAQSSAATVESSLRQAQTAKLDKAGEFLAKRFGPMVAKKIEAAHIAEEQRPIETLWDAATAVTAYAKAVPWQADRVELESQAGLILDMAA